jgi:HlyD family secretion protein
MRRLLLLLILAVVAVWGAVAWLMLAPRPAGGATGLATSGTLEARQVTVVTEVGGQLIRLAPREGDVVKAGAELAVLDTTFQDAQIARARAALDAANASLDMVRAGSRPEQIAQSRAALDRETAARDGAAQAVKDLQGILDNPQDLDAQISSMRAQVAQAEAAITLAQTQLRTAEIVRDKYQFESTADGRAQFQAALAQVSAADAGIQAAQANRDGAQTVLDLMVSMRAHPVSLTTQLHAAQSRLAQANASVGLAKATLDAVSAGPRPEDLSVAQAQVDQAAAALDQLAVQKDKMTLRAPTGGMVTALTAHNGENVVPGSKILVLANLDSIQLTLYVPEPQIGLVSVGQAVSVTVDGLPGQQFPGAVYFISPQAEFTPASVQTKDERAKTVFMVKVRLANPQQLLKPGMPADAVILGM